MKKVTPFFPNNPPLKTKVLSSLPLFGNLVGGSNSQQKRGGGVHTMGINEILYNIYDLRHMSKLAADFQKKDKNVYIFTQVSK